MIKSVCPLELFQGSLIFAEEHKFAKGQILAFVWKAKKKLFKSLVFKVQVFKIIVPLNIGLYNLVLLKQYYL